MDGPATGGKISKVNELNAESLKLKQAANLYLIISLQYFYRY
jgi:hypothetical protein